MKVQGNLTAINKLHSTNCNARQQDKTLSFILLHETVLRLFLLLLTLTFGKPFDKFILLVNQADFQLVN